MDEEDIKICGNCKYHQFENIDNGWVCVNSDSEYCADWTEYNDTCVDWEERNNTNEPSICM